MGIKARSTLAFAVAAAASLAVAGEAAAATAWTTVKSPSVHHAKHGNDLFRVVALSRNDAWAAGGYRVVRNGNLDERALMLHWDGAQWSRVRLPSPRASAMALHYLSAAGPQNVWATSGDEQDIMHYTDGKWVRVPPTGLPDTGFGGPIVATADGGAWMAGAAHYQHRYVGAVARFDGASWRVTRIPGPRRRHWGLYAIAAIPHSSQLVAVGESSWRPIQYAARFDGTSWTVQQMPFARYGSVEDLAAVSSHNIWAVGSRRHGALVEHYTASGWHIVRLPAAVRRLHPQLSGVATHGRRDVIMTGYYNPPNGGQRGLVLRFNGRRVVRVATPNPGRAPARLDRLNAAASIPGTRRFWLVGGWGAALRHNSRKTWTLRGR